MWKRAALRVCIITSVSLPLAAQQAAPLPSEQSLLTAAQQNPNDASAQQRMGEYYLHQERLPEGILYLQRTLQLDPQNYNAGYDLSLAYLNSGDPAHAASQLHALIAQHETPDLDDLLAKADDRSGDFKAAAVEYHRAAELDPTEQNIFDLATFLLQHTNYEGFLDNALKFFTYGVQKYPRSAQLTVGMGVALYADGRYDDAVRTLCAAVDLDPKDPKPFQFLGKVSTVSPAYIPQIRKRLEGLVNLYPQNGPALYYYAMSLWRRSDGEPSADLANIEVLLKRSIAADPTFYEAHFQLGVLYQDEQKYTDAIQQFNQTLALQPDFNRAHYRLFLLYNRTHQKQLADQHLAQLKQLKKEDEDAEDK
jgi:tetratricopeptide (TPR) repeat protein